MKQGRSDDDRERDSEVPDVSRARAIGIPDGGWGKKTTEAWQQYQADYGFFPTRPFVQGYDPEGKLLPLAESAGVLVPLPGGDSGASGVRAFFDTAQSTKLPYGWSDHGNGSMLTWAARTRSRRTCHRSDLESRWTQARSIGKYAIVYGPA